MDIVETDDPFRELLWRGTCFCGRHIFSCAKTCVYYLNVTWFERFALFREAYLATKGSRVQNRGSHSRALYPSRYKGLLVTFLEVLETWYSRMNLNFVALDENSFHLTLKKL
jgi:hypothetical protein